MRAVVFGVAILCGILCGILCVAGCEGTDDVRAPAAGGDSSGVSVDVTSKDVPITDVGVPDISPDSGVSPDVEDACPPGSGCFLDPCEAPGDCVSGFCVDHLGDTVCTQGCIEDCPSGFSCKNVTSFGNDITFLCVSNTPQLCRPCRDTIDCGSPTGALDACVQYGDLGAFCGASCSGDSDCPAGYGCQEATSVQGQTVTSCVHLDGVCPCSDLSIELALVTNCAARTDDGACWGERFCGPGGLSQCDAEPPSAEICDGQDNNCDGHIDEVACDDGNPCTQDACGADGCLSTPLPGVPCDDGEPGTKLDICSTAGVCVGEPYVCVADTCQAASHPDGVGCVPEFAALGTVCDDGLTTTKADLCDGNGVCAGVGYICEVGPCEAAATPDGAGCDVEYLAAGLGCDDNQVGTTDDICDGSGGCAGTAYTCEPGTCEKSSAANGDGCDVVFSAAGVACNDADSATKIDICDGQGSCGGTPFACPEPTPCTPGYTPDGAGCVATVAAAGVTCDDGALNTKDDSCNGQGACVGTFFACPQPTTCIPETTADGSVCGPTYAPDGAACDDGLASTTGDACDGAGSCVGGDIQCPAPTICTPGYTLDGSGCVPVHALAGTGCNDQDSATNVDTCNGAGQCSGQPYACPVATDCVVSYAQDGSGCVAGYAPSGAACNDTDSATSNDVCDGIGTCSGTLIICPGVTVCTPGYETDGAGCIPQHAALATPCNDGFASTTGDACDGAGACVGSDIQCPAATVCTPGYTLDGAGCVAVHALVGTGCNDQDTATNADTCNGAGQCSGQPYVCPAATDCLVSYAQDGSGCVASHAPSGAACNDADSATSNDVCDGIGTCSGTSITCPSATVCTPGHTTDGAGCIPQYALATTACDDGLSTTLDDTCDGQGSCVGDVFACPAPQICTPAYIQNDDTCTPVHALVDTGCNDDDDSTTEDRCDGAGTCAGTPYTCPAPTICTPAHSQNGLDCIPVFALTGSGCSDGDNTTQGDSCDGAGICSGSPYQCPTGTICTPSHTQDGQGCVPVFALTGSGCDDTDPTTHGDACDGAGSCVGSPYTCPDATLCTLSHTQDGQGCIPVFALSGAHCSDADNATLGDVCDGAGSCAGTPYTCAPPTVCTPSHAQDGQDCIAQHAPVGSTCSDADDTTHQDQCDGAGACAGAPYTCPDATACTPTHTQNGLDCTAVHALTGATCDDEDSATQSDVCDGAGQCAGTPYTCPDMTECTTAYIQDGAGCVATHAAIGTTCDDQDPATNTDQCDGAGGCAGQTQPCDPTIETFDHSGGATSWTVPNDACSAVSIEARGAQGGARNYSHNGSGPAVGGKGAQMVGTFAVSAGDAIDIRVGGQGGTSNTWAGGGGGGGGSFVTRSGQILVIAGGGGGADAYRGIQGQPGLTTELGGPGWAGSLAPLGGGGTNPGTAGGNGGGGGGGGWTAAGAGSNLVVGGAAAGGVGGPGSYGGAGGFGGGGSSFHGGGGGGGYSGGSGGMAEYDGSGNDRSGGGGGSKNNGTDAAATAGLQSGHGQVLITWTACGCAP